MMDFVQKVQRFVIRGKGRYLRRNHTKRDTVQKMQNTFAEKYGQK